MASQKLVKKLDKLFSEFIRKRDSKNEAFVCCSCQEIKPYSQADAGHYINRRFMATRWREDNVHAQCRKCNRFSEGAGAGYSLFMIKTYGIKRVEYLDSLKNEIVKYTDSELELMIRDYRAKLKTSPKAGIGRYRYLQQ